MVVILQLGKQVNVETAKKRVIEKQVKKKTDPEMQLEGNLKLNKVRKMQFKKDKKKKNRAEKVALQLSAGLENVEIKTNKAETENYDFDADFVMS